MAKTDFSMERFFLALADTTRLRLLNLMAEQEICVCYLVEVLGQGQPKISRHLAYLRGAGLVKARRDGKWMHYRMVKPAHRGAAKILRQVMKWMAEDAAMSADRAKLGKACCSPGKFGSLGGCSGAGQGAGVGGIARAWVAGNFGVEGQLCTSARASEPE